MVQDLTAQEVGRMLSAEVHGDSNRPVRGVGDIRVASETDLCFVAAEKYLPQIGKSPARVWLIHPELFEKGLDAATKNSRTFILVPHPYLGFVKVASHFFPIPKSKPGVHKMAFVDPSAEVHPTAQIDAFVSIGARARVGAGAILNAHTWIGDEAQIGEDSILYGNVSVYPRTVIGKRAVIHSGAVIGSDGFGFIKDQQTGEQIKIPQVGRVVIHDDVEIGANTCIDRSTLGDTVICQGAKIDNLVQIAHNCEVGKNTVVCAMSGMAGSSKVGDDVVLAGAVHLGGHLSIGDRTQIAGWSGVTKDVPAGQSMKGYPLRPVNEFLKIQSIIGKLPEIYKRLLKLEEKVDGK